MKIKKRYIAAAAANAAAIVLSAVLTVCGNAAAERQAYNFAAERWKGSSSTDYAQISTFFSDDAGFTTDSVGSARTQFIYTLQNVSIAEEDGKRQCPDAYSAPTGNMTMTNGFRSFESEVTAVGGDFFMFRSFRLLDGAYFSDSDVMQDGVVIDSTLAWQLFGSYDIAGKDVKLDGMQLRIAAVVDDPQTKEEKHCYGDKPKAYISYKAASKLMQAKDPGEEAFRRVNCYEFIMPDPVDSFAYKSMKEYFGSWGSDAEIIQNTDRFSQSVLKKKLKKLKYSMVRDSEIQLPFWENASRITEYRLTYLYSIVRVCRAVTVLTVVWLVIKGCIALKRRKKMMFTAVRGFAGKCAAKMKGMIKREKKTS